MSEPVSESENQPEPGPSSSGEPKAKKRLSTPKERRFVVALSKDSALISPFELGEFVEAMVGAVKSVKGIRRDKYLIETHNEAQAQMLLDYKGPVNGQTITFGFHDRLNRSCGVIHNESFSFMEDSIILDGFRSLGVFSIKRLLKKGKAEEGEIGVDKTHKNSGSFVLYFDSRVRPREIHAHGVTMNVDTYYQNPNRCSKCQNFGHIPQGCQKAIVCGRCGITGHDATDCTRPFRCHNCQGKHPAWSSSCPTYHSEVGIIKLRVDKNLSYKQAKRLYVDKLKKVYPKEMEKTHDNIIGLMNRLQGAVNKMELKVEEVSNKLTTLSQEHASSSEPPTPTRYSRNKRYGKRKKRRKR